MGTNEKNSSMFYGWIILLVSCVLYMVCLSPAQYGYSIMMPSMMEDMRMTATQANLGLSLGFGVVALISPLVGKVVDKYGARLCTIIGATGVAVSSFIMFYCIRSWVAFTLTFGIAFTVFKSLCTLAPLQKLQASWFKEKRALALGLLSSSAGFGGLIFTPILKYAINKNSSWRIAWMIIGILAIICMVLAILFIKNEPSDVGEIPDGKAYLKRKSKMNNTGKKKRKTYITEQNWSLEDAVRNRVFWIIVISAIGTMFSATGIIGNAEMYIKSINLETKMAVVGLFSGVSIFGRMFGGYICNYIEGKKALLIGHIFNLIGILLLLTAKNSVMLYLFSVVFGLGYGTTYTIPTVLFSSYYGHKNYGSIFGVYWTFQTFMSMISPVLTGYIKDVTGNYNLAWFVMLGVVAISCIATANIKVPVKNCVVYESCS